MNTKFTIKYFESERVGAMDEVNALLYPFNELAFVS
jgi:hypothetical protein